MASRRRLTHCSPFRQCLIERELPGEQNEAVAHGPIFPFNRSYVDLSRRSSAKIGQGSEFRVRLPISDAASSQALPLGKSSEAAMPIGACRILVVEDNIYVSESMPTLLRLKNFEPNSKLGSRSRLKLAATRDASCLSPSVLNDRRFRQGQCETEEGASARIVVGPYLSIVRLDDCTRNRQADTHALCFRGHEWFE